MDHLSTILVHITIIIVAISNLIVAISSLVVTVMNSKKLKVIGKNVNGKGENEQEA